MNLAHKQKIRYHEHRAGWLFCGKRLSSSNSSNNNNKLNPWFVTGFLDGECCFYVNLIKSKTKIGWAVQTTMSLELHRKDLPLLKSIQLFFNGVGNISLGEY
jgi:hypothetical protein